MFGGSCNKCNGVFKLRKGKKGKFYGCSNYPECKNTKEYTSTCKTCNMFSPGESDGYCISKDPNDSCDKHPDFKEVNWVERFCNKHNKKMIHSKTQSETKGVFIEINLFTCTDCLMDDTLPATEIRLKEDD